MRYCVLRLAVAVLTFIIGITSAAVLGQTYRAPTALDLPLYWSSPMSELPPPPSTPPCVSQEPHILYPLYIQGGEARGVTPMPAKPVPPPALHRPR